MVEFDERAVRTRLLERLQESHSAGLRPIVATFFSAYCSELSPGKCVHVPSRPMRCRGAPGKMKLLRREWLHRYRCRLYKSPVVSGALGDTALRGWTVKWIRSLGIGNSRPRFLLAPAIVLMLALSLSAAAQNQYYVSTTGSNSSSGTSPSTPWRTCSHAIAAFSLGGGGARASTFPRAIMAPVPSTGVARLLRIAWLCNALNSGLWVEVIAS